MPGGIGRMNGGPSPRAWGALYAPVISNRYFFMPIYLILNGHIIRCPVAYR